MEPEALFREQKVIIILGPLSKPPFSESDCMDLVVGVAVLNTFTDKRAQETFGPRKRTQLEQWCEGAAEATGSIEGIFKRHKSETATDPRDTTLPASHGSAEMCAHFIQKLDEFLQAQSGEVRSRSLVLRLRADFRAAVFLFVSLSTQFVDASAAISSKGATSNNWTAREDLMQQRFSSLLDGLLEHTKKVILAEPHLDDSFISWSALSPTDSRCPRIGRIDNVMAPVGSEDVWSDLPVGDLEQPETVELAHAEVAQEVAQECLWGGGKSEWESGCLSCESPFNVMFGIEPDIFGFDDKWGESDQLFC